MRPARLDGVTTARFTLNFRGDEHGAVFGCLSTSDLPEERLDQLAGRWLHHTELERYAKLPLVRRKSSFLLGRLLAKTAVRGSGVADDPRDIAIDSGIFGQPVLRDSGAAFRLTLSHTDGLVCAVVSDPGVPFGIDVERFVDDRVPSLRQALSGDFDRLAASRGLLSEEHFAFVLWTQKESVGKATNIGLTSPMSTYDISRFEWPVPGRIHAEFSNLTQFACETCCSERFAVSFAYPRLGVLSRHLDELLADAEEAAGWA